MDLELSIYSLSHRSFLSSRSRCGILRLTRKASNLEQVPNPSDVSGAVHYNKSLVTHPCGKKAVKAPASTSRENGGGKRRYSKSDHRDLDRSSLAVDVTICNSLQLCSSQLVLGYRRIAYMLFAACQWSVDRLGIKLPPSSGLFAVSQCQY